MVSIIEKIGEIAEVQFKEAELNGCFLIEVIQNGKKLEVYIDSDEGVKFRQCQKFSRAIESYLDTELILGEDYTLEVSSPGVDRPLKFKRQYPRHLGRKLEITLAEEKMVTGKFMEFEDDELTIRVQGAKKGQFKKMKIKFEEIVEAKVLVSFSKK